MLESILPLLSLIALEVVLGIDNIVFISILSDKLPENQRDKLRYLGLLLAMIMRLALLSIIAWILKLNISLFEIGSISITGKGLILIVGGLFLIYKSCKELYQKYKNHSPQEITTTKKIQFSQLLIEVIILDLVFSVDSIITAVGMVKDLWIMYTAVIVTVVIMLFTSKPISAFINKNPSFKILALCFLLLIGISLIAEGLTFEIPKGYIYFSMGFSFLVDFIQLKLIKK